MMVLGGCLLTISSVFGMWRDENANPYLIGFLSNRDGGSEVYTMNENGTNVRQLTFQGDNGLQHCWFDWSLNGQDIYVEDGYDYYLGGFSCAVHRNFSKLDFEGHYAYRLKLEDLYDTAFLLQNYSHAFMFRVSDENAELFQVNLGNGEIVYLKNLDAAYMPYAVISSDRDWVVLLENVVDKNRASSYFFQISKLNSDGNSVDVVQPDILFGYSPIAVSPDGTRIAIVGSPANVSDPFKALYLLSFGERVGEWFYPTIGLSNSELAWSPNGQWLAFRDQLDQIGILSLLTGMFNYVAGTKADDTHVPKRHSLSWSSDSEWLIYSQSNGLEEPHKIYRIHPDGTYKEQLTHGNYDDIMPKYSPHIALPYKAGIPFGAGIACLLAGFIPRHRRRNQ
jgi:Tol biopolymer transport system component